MVIPKVHHTTTAQSAGFEGLGGGALNKLFAKCINFALLAAMQNVIHLPCLPQCRHYLFFADAIHRTFSAHELKAKIYCWKSGKQCKSAGICKMLVGRLFQGLPARFSLKMIHWIIFRALKPPNPGGQCKHCGCYVRKQSLSGDMLNDLSQFTPVLKVEKYPIKL